jgi:molecular chaperone GrpE
MAESKKADEKETKDKSNSKKSKNNKASEQIEELELQLAEARDKHLRLFAEFENFKKRNTRERFELMKTAAQDTINAILPVLDDFDRAKKAAEDKNTSEQLSEGILMVYNKLYTVLGNKGLTPMESTGKEFDPELHEAITEIPAPTEEMKGKVVDTVENGYYLNDKIIRFAKVVVGK